MRLMGQNRGAACSAREGLAIVPALMVSTLIAMLGLSMLAATLTGSRVVNYQGDEHRLTSAVESVAAVTTERIWSTYVDLEGGAPGSIESFRAYLDAQGIPDSGPGGPPTADEGVELVAFAGIPGADVGNPEFDDVNIDALRIVRRDVGDSTQLYVTVSASTNRGQGIINPVLNRAIQVAYTVEPSDFEGFQYGILANNVNCIFCHTVVESTDSYFNTDPERFGTFPRVKVGALESLMIRNSPDGRPQINDWDADSYIAGSLYLRGSLTDQDGLPITAGWNDLSFQSFHFDEDGLLSQDAFGNLLPEPYSPAGDPPQAGENLYLDYPTNYSDMPDGDLPTAFPPPIPDDGGIDPVTGLPDPDAAGNRRVDPSEFYAASQTAEGSVIAGIINVTDPSFVIDTVPEYAAALMTGNQPSLPSTTAGNVVLSGTLDNPIVIDGTVAIDGDVVINGYVKGTGTIIASGNIYVPTDLQYLDGTRNGQRTFGIAQDGTKNALGLAAGGNIMLGDYLKPSIFTAPGKYEIVTGDASGDFNFALAELSLFNRKEWAKTQPQLPGPGGAMVANPDYDPNYVPRYYHFGPGDEIPIYNKGDLYFDPATNTWRGDAEVPLDWDSSMLTIWDPTDTSNPELYDPATGEPRAAIHQLTPTGGWLSDEMQKLAIEYFEGQHEDGTPMKIDGLLYTNNAIFGIVHRSDVHRGQLEVNGALVCADLGLLTPGKKSTGTEGTSANPPDSPYKIGLRLNYDRRTKGMLNVKNPHQVTIRRTLWKPTANIL